MVASTSSNSSDTTILEAVCFFGGPLSAIIKRPSQREKSKSGPKNIASTQTKMNVVSFESELSKLSKDSLVRLLSQISRVHDITALVESHMVYEEKCQQLAKVVLERKSDGMKKKKEFDMSRFLFLCDESQLRHISNMVIGTNNSQLHFKFNMKAVAIWGSLHRAVVVEKRLSNTFSTRSLN